MSSTNPICDSLTEALWRVALADRAGAPPGQHEFVAVNIHHDGRVQIIARFPVHVLGDVERTRERAMEEARKCAVPGRAPAALEIYPPVLVEALRLSLTPQRATEPADAANNAAALVVDDGPVALTLESGDDVQVVARFATISDAESFLGVSATIDPDDLHAGRYGIDAPHGLSSDNEAEEAARALGFYLFYADGDGEAYYVRGEESAHRRSAWNGPYRDIVAAAFAALATVDPDA